MKKCTLIDGSWMVKITDNGFVNAFGWAQDSSKEYILIAENQKLPVSSDGDRFRIEPNDTIIKDPISGEIGFTRKKFIKMINSKPLVWEGEVKWCEFNSIYPVGVGVYYSLLPFVGKRTRIRVEEII